MAAATPQVPFIDKESNQKMNRLREELDRMQNQVLRMRETYQTTLSNKKAYTQLRAFQINYKFELNKDDASYTLAIDTEVPIDNVLLQCNVPIDLLDSDKNSCVLSYSECEENVITLKCLFFLVVFYFIHRYIYFIYECENVYLCGVFLVLEGW